MDNRSALMECALKLLAARGYDAVGVQDIVEAAGVTKPTLYHYFGSKGGLFSALLEQYYGELNRQVGEAARYRGDLTGTLTRLAWTFFRYATAHPTYYRAQLALSFAPQESQAWELVSAYQQEQVAAIEQLFVAAVQDHGNMRGRHKAYAASFIGLMHTYIHLWLQKQVQFSDELVYQTVHQFEHGIYS